MVSKLFLLSFLYIYPILADTDGPWETNGVSGYAGMITMNALTGSSLFYWLFESIGGNITSDSRPLILWLQGGPGCSGELGMLFENISPLTVNDDAASVFDTDQNYTWATDYHIITVDFPYGAGYSYANSERDQKNTTLTATNYLYRFLTKLQTKYPTWFNRSFYIFGESYGGHWVPGLAYNILINNQTGGQLLNLTGIGIGDPWVDPPTQTQSYSKYAMATSLINFNQYSVINYYQNQVSNYLRTNQPYQAEANWENTYNTIVNFANGINVYNVREYGDYNFKYIQSWLNKAATKTLLHVPSFAFWTPRNNTMYDYYLADIMTARFLS